MTHKDFADWLLSLYFPVGISWKYQSKTPIRLGCTSFTAHLCWKSHWNCGCTLLCVDFLCTSILPLASACHGRPVTSPCSKTRDECYVKIGLIVQHWPWMLKDSADILWNVKRNTIMWMGMQDCVALNLLSLHESFFAIYFLIYSVPLYYSV